MAQGRLDFGAQPESSAPKRRDRTMSVRQLTERLERLLEVEFYDVWVEGEISNLKFASSGHWYFSLKDRHAQIRAVCWRTQARRLRFKPRDGMTVVVRGGVRVYAPRGEYQLVVELLEPLGKGALQEAFEQLKARLGREGLFDQERKRPLPRLPRRVGVVSSPTGAVIRDIARVLGPDVSGIELLLYPARVQGDEAAGELAQGIRALGQLGDLDVIVIARGGGSLEDLWPFNDESVARALAASPVPTVSAVGHETDYTIADFVADVRAPTPSAAADLLARPRREAARTAESLRGRLHDAAGRALDRARGRLERVSTHRVFEAERGRLRRAGQGLGERARRAQLALEGRRARARERLTQAAQRLDAFRWERQASRWRDALETHRRRLDKLAADGVRARRDRVLGITARLEALSPLAVLGRGYALVWDGDGTRLLRDSADVQVGDRVRVRLRDGAFAATVAAKGDA